MSAIVRMPAVLAGVTEAAVQAWLVAPGQQIEVGDPLAEIETEKAVVEYASEVAGTVGQLLVGEGESAAVGTPIAVVLKPGEGPDAVGPAPADAGLRPSETPKTPSGGDPGVRRDDLGESVIPGLTRDLPSDRMFASPLVRRLASERGIDLTQLTGTGPRGRIVRRDLEALPDPAPAVAAGPSARPEPEVVPLTRMRKAIARRVSESKATAPHFYVTAHCRVDRLLDARRQLNELSSRKVSINDFVLKAMAGALQDVPKANAVWAGDHILRHRTVDIGVAVAVEDGLLAPVARDVDQLGLIRLSETVADLADRARSGRLQQAELEGGAFSVSNLGMYAVDEFAAILNPPQSGILAVAAARSQPVVEQGRLAVGTVMTVTLSADHRVIDGVLAAEWLAAFVRRMENPLSLLW